MTRRKPDPEMVDDENPELGADWFASARPASEMLPDILGAAGAAALLKRRGRPKAEHPKEPVKLRLDAEVVAAYRASGPRWQSRMNEVLRQHMPKKGEAQS